MNHKLVFIFIYDNEIIFRFPFGCEKGVVPMSLTGDYFEFQKQKVALAKQLNLSPRQVEVWFQNRRAR